MGATQQFSLRWNNYVQHITCAFDSLRTDEDLVDVTLSCEGKKIYAHKMLLSACSNYFKDVFKDNPCKHPVIIFRNVKYEDLLAIIDFMYHGEVNVAQEQLSSFLTTAEMLAVQGLSVGSTAPKEEIRRRQPVFVESSSLQSTRDSTPFGHQNNVKLPSRPLGTQNPPGPHSAQGTRPSTPPRKRRLSPANKQSVPEKEPLVKRKPRELPMKVEAEEADEEEESFAEDGMIDVSQLELSHVESESPVKTESVHSPEEVGEKLAALEQQKGQAGTSAVVETADEEKTDEEYLEEDDESEKEYAYVVLGEDGKYRYINSASVSAEETEEGTVAVNELDEESEIPGKMLFVQTVDTHEEDDENQQEVEYIYAEGVSENNEIIIGEVPKFQCDRCDRTFKRLDSLYKHNSMHTGHTECPACGAVFSRVAHRTRHMRIKHPDYPIVLRKPGRTRKT